MKTLSVGSQPRYVIGQTIKVPAEVQASKEVRIVGYEWGEGLRGQGAYWVYYLVIPGQESWRLVSEMEISDWQK